jgi:hypothetical protein
VAIGQRPLLTPGATRFSSSSERSNLHQLFDKVIALSQMAAPMRPHEIIDKTKRVVRMRATFIHAGSHDERAGVSER